MTANRRYTPENNALPEHLSELLLTQGLNGALLIQPSFLGCDNSYLLDTLLNDTHHKTLKFKGVVVLDPWGLAAVWITYNHGTYFSEYIQAST